MSLSQPTCPIDKESKCSLFWGFKINGNEYKLYKCDKCDLVFYDPFPDINYESHTDSISSLKDYVHLNVNIEGMIYLLLDNIQEGKVTSMLEVGCGFGFTLDFAKRVLNMDVVGYEPSLYGEIGAKELNLNIKRTYLTKDDLRDKKYDIIFLSEVLEHIQDPAAFIELLKYGLTENGVLILTTPDYKKLKKDLSVPTDLALLSPEAHVILFSERSLHKLLSDAGFGHVSVVTPGSSLVAVSSAAKIKRRDFQNRNDIIRKYYQTLLNEVKPASFTYVGILYKLLRNYVDHGDYRQTDQLFNNYPFPILPSVFEVSQIDSEEALNHVSVNCAAMMSYYIGIMRLNYYRDYEQATNCFIVSHELCSKRLQFVPNASVLEFELVWLAKYHVAVAMMYNDKNLEALTTAREIINFQRSEQNRHLPAPGADLLERARELVTKVIERL
jgi:SAM-dependent methyltransferase